MEKGGSLSNILSRERKRLKGVKKRIYITGKNVGDPRRGTAGLYKNRGWKKEGKSRVLGGKRKRKTVQKKREIGEGNPAGSARRGQARVTIKQSFPMTETLKNDENPKEEKGKEGKLNRGGGGGGELEKGTQYQ